MAQRLRKKKNLIPRQDACGDLLVRQPQSLRGKWLDGHPEQQLHIEIGCGRGGFTVQTAAANPDVLLVGIERVADAMIVGMERAVAENVTNLRFIDLDAITLAEVFAPGEVSRIYLNFSDPWKSPRHEKRRLTSPVFLQVYQKILASGGQIHMKTDNDRLFLYSRRILAECGFSLSEVTEDLHQHGTIPPLTDYEQKFIEQGLTINRLVATWMPTT